MNFFETITVNYNVYNFSYMQVEWSVRFTHSIHAHCVKIQRVNQNLILLCLLSLKTISELCSMTSIYKFFHSSYLSFGRYSRPWSELEFTWYISSWLLSIELTYEPLRSKLYLVSDHKHLQSIQIHFYQAFSDNQRNIEIFLPLA